MSQEDNQTAQPEGADGLPGGSAPGGAQTRPEAQGGARAERDEAGKVPETPATQARDGSRDSGTDG